MDLAMVFSLQGLLPDALAELEAADELGKQSTPRFPGLGYWRIAHTCSPSAAAWCGRLVLAKPGRSIPPMRPR